MLHDDLLEQAQILLELDNRKPKQANLRRAISSAYYAVFHALGDHVAKQVVGSSPKDNKLRALIIRSLQHNDMREALKGFASGNPRAIYKDIIAEEADETLQTVAQSFLDLQHQRHKADYDVAYNFTKLSTRVAVRDAEKAIVALDSREEDASPFRKVFMLSMILHKTLKLRD